ncbi:hypothetical protein CSC75_07395 [Pseudoxanthomonas wuyuanensis]|nr:hypothetical protein CSC75_07395 [Pseudoxanthomonas wuyuanensis]
MIDKVQFKQTIIGTASVGAVVGILPVLGSIAIRSERVAGPDSFYGWLVYALNLAGVFVGCIVFCVTLFGLLPMVLQHRFVKLVRLWTGRA